MIRPRRLIPHLLLAGAFALPAGGCGLLGNIPGAECDALKTGNFAALKVEGGAEVKGKITTFLEAAVSLDKLVVDMEADLIAACGELGFGAGMSASELSAKPAGGDGAKEVCGKVAAKIEAVLEANAEAELELSIAPPRCYADITAMSSCMAGCGAVIEPGEMKASCEGGEIAGQCSAKCSGTCSASGGVQCKGGCDGICEGKCNGDTSSGECSGTCEGKCQGGCELEGEASCQGTCSGECSVAMKAPKCTGEFKPPKVDPSCHARCSAKAAASATCEPPAVKVAVKGEANAELGKLVAALRVKLPAVIKIQLGTAQRLEVAAKSVVSAGAELPSVAGEAGLQALGCVAAAAELAGSASASVSVNVEASASVSGAAGT